MTLVSFTNITDGTTIDAADVNTPLNTIYNAFNGNIDATNITDGAITGSKIASAVITPDKVAGPTTITSSATITPTSTSRMVVVTALAVGTTIAAPTGSFTDGQAIIIRIKDNGTAQTIGFNAVYRAVGTTLPTTTVISKELYIGAVYNLSAGKWDVIAVNKEA